MADSCSHWWHAPFYIAMSVALAFIAISSIHQQFRTNSSISSQFLRRNLSLNASRALRSHGFNVMATLLQISPELFLSTPESTIFAVQDSTISNTSGHLPPSAMKQLMQYHTSPAKLPIQALLKKPQGSCLNTLLPKMYLKITKVDEEKGLIEINNALISHPDLFLDGPFSVHGVIGSLSSLGIHHHHHLDKDWNLNIRSDPICEDFSHVSIKSKIGPIQWRGIIQFLSTNGFSQFASGLQSVVDGIVEDYGDLGSVTIFAPQYFAFLAMPSPMLDRAVRLHILPQRHSYTELGLMPDASALKTLAYGEDVELHKSDDSGAMAVDGVVITAAEIFVSKDVIIHGISGSLGASG